MTAVLGCFGLGMDGAGHVGSQLVVGGLNGLAWIPLECSTTPAPLRSPSWQGVGHIPMEERPGEFNALLSDFVRQAVLEQQGR